VVQSLALGLAPAKWHTLAGLTVVVCAVVIGLVVGCGVGFSVVIGI